MNLYGFDTDYYLGEVLNYYQSRYSELSGFTTSDIDSALQSMGMTAEQHYLSTGWQMELSPNAYFDPVEYTLAWEARYPSESFSGIDPYQHYLMYGAARDVNPSNDFDESLYLESLLDFGKTHSPEAWSSLSVSDLRTILANNNMTALTLHIDYDSDSILIPVSEVPLAERVNAPPPDNGDTVLTVNMEANQTYFAADGTAEVFVYEIDSSSGRAVQSDGEVVIKGFNPSEDMIRFQDEGNGGITVDNFKSFKGVGLNENPFDDYTSIYFDPENGNEPGGIIIQGIQDAGLDLIHYEVA